MADGIKYDGSTNTISLTAAGNNVLTVTGSAQPTVRLTGSIEISGALKFPDGSDIMSGFSFGGVTSMQLSGAITASKSEELIAYGFNDKTLNSLLTISGGLNVTGNLQVTSSFGSMSFVNSGGDIKLSSSNGLKIYSYNPILDPFLKGLDLVTNMPINITGGELKIHSDSIYGAVSSSEIVMNPLIGFPPDPRMEINTPKLFISSSNLVLSSSFSGPQATFNLTASFKAPIVYDSPTLYTAYPFSPPYNTVIISEPKGRTCIYNGESSMSVTCSIPNFITPASIVSVIWEKVPADMFGNAHFFTVSASFDAFRVDLVSSASLPATSFGDTFFRWFIIN